MATPTIEEICPRLKDLKLSGAGECNGDLLLFSSNPDLAAAELRTTFGSLDGGHDWIEVIQKATFSARLPPTDRGLSKTPSDDAAETELQAGDEIGTVDSTSDTFSKTGTLGGIVFDANDDPYILSAWHSTSEPVYEQDSVLDVANSVTRIGNFDPNGGSMDCALAKITDPGNAKQTLKFPLASPNEVFQNKPGDAKQSEFVQLCGSVAKRQTIGQVVCPRFQCILVDIGGTEYKFNNQILIQGTFGALGDSGGIVLRDNQGKLEALGLYFASSKFFTFSVATPLTDIFDEIKRTQHFYPKF